MTLKSTFWLVLFALTPALCAAQKPYFQQEVHYDIRVSLNDSLHQLRGQAAIQYINNSPDSLGKICMHLWPNAYKNRSTAYARQALLLGDDEFHFAAADERGFIDQLDFEVDGESTPWNFDKKHIDIAWLQLEKPLLPGDTLLISTPFLVQLPYTFSRLGHEEQSYHITQWYPKPAVYDRQGWHPMPYLDIGEFYSDFGNFDVEINLPKNYIVAATGELITADERQFIQEKIEETNKRIGRGFGQRDGFPPSSPQNKTIRFKANRVHDFAWFADKRFFVQKGQALLPSGKKVDTYAYFTNREANLWIKATDYLVRALQFYSDQVGEYPWPQVTAVQGSNQFGEGMEYPMITLIGLMEKARDLDEIIAHEVGHNWFYGILATNERDHPWLDEGLNTFFEQRYIAQYYAEEDQYYFPDFLTKNSRYNIPELAYLFQARRNLDQPADSPADAYNTINYFTAVYEKPALGLRLLSKYIGYQKVDSIIKAFYGEWQFKHPQPEDLQAAFETSVDRDLSWFFEDLIGSAKTVNYALTGIHKTDEGWKLKVKNKGKATPPLSLALTNKDSLFYERWVEGFEDRQSFTLPEADGKHFIADHSNYLWDFNRYNNKIRTKGLFKKIRPIKLSLLGGLENPEKSNLYWFAAAGWNNYDKLMIGLSLYNRILLEKKFSFAIAPMYAPVTREITGLGEARYNFLPSKGPFQRIIAGVTAKRFNYDQLTVVDTALAYTHVQPYLKFKLSKAPINPVFQEVKLSATIIDQEMALFSGPSELEAVENQSLVFFRGCYTFEKRLPVNQASGRLEFEYSSNGGLNFDESYTKLSLELMQNYTFKPKRSMDFRLFLGYFPSNPAKGNATPFPQAFALTYQGFNDYAFQEFFFGRSDASGFWSQQIAVKEGGFKNAFGPAFRGPGGFSNDFMLAFNFKSDLPINLSELLPLKPYFDLAYTSSTKQWWWSGGLQVEYGNGVFSAYFPLINSKEIDNLYKQQENKKYLRRVTFSLHLHKLHPWRLLDRIRL